MASFYFTREAISDRVPTTLLTGFPSRRARGTQRMHGMNPRTAGRRDGGVGRDYNSAITHLTRTLVTAVLSCLICSHSKRETLVLL